MVERSTSATSARLDRTFAALADPTRRAILMQLRAGAATISRIATPFAMSFAAVSKHVQVLERAGLLAREVAGREHHLSLDATPLREAANWALDYRAFWEQRLDALEAYLEERKALEKRTLRRTKRAPRRGRA